jgi:hypothetical protein
MTSFPTAKDHAMNRISFRILSALSLAAVLIVSAYAKPPAGDLAANLTPEQANATAATANTPDQHAQLAHFFRLQADRYAAEITLHQQMIAAYKADATKVSTKNRTATVGHCENEVRVLQAKVAESQKLAETHELAAGISPAAPSGAQAADACCGGKCNQAGHDCCKGQDMNDCCGGKCKQSKGDCCGGHMNMK